MFEFLEKVTSFDAGLTKVNVYFGNLHQQGKIGLPTFDEAKLDYHAIEQRQNVYIDAYL